jgi:group I intron endonuclease
MSELNCKVYVLKEPNSEIVRYVGITTYPLQKRYIGHVNDPKKTYKTNWIKSLKLNGLLPEIELVEDGLSFEEALKKEIEYIKLFKACGARLVNGTLGGEGSMGYKHTENSKKKLSLSLKGRQFTKEHKNKISLGLIGKLHSKESYRKFSEFCKTRTGKKNPFYGKRHSEETKKKLSITAKINGTYKYATEVSRITNRRPVLQYDLHGNFLREFCSVKEAGESVSRASTNISASCSGRKNVIGGFIWKYKTQNNA